MLDCAESRISHKFSCGYDVRHDFSISTSHVFSVT